MAGCTECSNYRNDYGPADSLYCRAFSAKFSHDESNPQGAKDAAMYNAMGWKATTTCPHGNHHKDYD